MQNPLTPKKYVWILHPDHPEETIGLGRTGPHWRSHKKGTVPNVHGVPWEFGMQQVTVDHIYPQFMKSKVMYPGQHRSGIETISDALTGEFAEDATVVWKTNYLKLVEVGGVKTAKK